jgi:glycerol-3-phosphate dehydrogenase
VGPSLVSEGHIGRDVDAARTEQFDVAVIGGGIYGIALAFESARRGLRTVLLERDDFGGGTSRNWLRILHGGLRYLQTLDLHRFRESVAERSWFLRNFPELVEPLPCLMPLYGPGLRRPSAFRMAFMADSMLGWRRNDDLAPSHRLPAGRVLDVQETARRFPAVDRHGLLGGALWYDAIAAGGPRLVIELLRWACAAGTLALNRVEAQRLLLDGGLVAGLAALDRVTGAELMVRAPVVVNAAGPSSRGLAADLDQDMPALFRPSLAFNLLLDRPPLAEVALALAPRRPRSQTFFLCPCRDRMVAGTWHAPWTGPVHDPKPQPAMVDAILAELNATVRGLDLVRRDVLGIYAGLLPATREGTADLAVREIIHDHGARGGPDGLFSISGVKFTTARLVAGKTLHRAFERRGRHLPPVRHVARPPAHSVPPADRFIQLARTQPSAARGLIETLMREEAAASFDDVIYRRTDWGDDPAATAAARTVLERAPAPAKETTIRPA